MITQVIKSDCGCEFEISPTGQVFRWCPLHRSAPEIYETGKQLLQVMCELCRRLNPQHKDCESCEEIEEYRKAYAKAEDKA